MNAPAVFAFDLGGTELKSAIVHADGSLREFAAHPSRALESELGPLEAMSEAFASLRRSLGRDPSGAGVGCPGVLHPETGALLGATPHLPHWGARPLRDELEARFGVPVTVDNDANLAALAEQRLGAARGARVSLTVTLGTGLGCGIVVDGRVMRGAHGGAGELGHVPLGTGELECACGIERCVEPDASGEGLARLADARGLGYADAHAVFDAAHRGEAAAVGLVEHFADRLGAALGTAVQLLNPDVIVLGGGIAQAGETLLTPLHAALARYALATHRRGLRLVIGQLGVRAGVIGAGLSAWQRAGMPV